MFTQLFRGPNGGVVEITWTEGKYHPRAMVVAGVPRSCLNEQTLRWADDACLQRMAERGEHAEEPQ